MSNYPNMSYCMCENTLLALRQVMDAMEDEGPQFLKEMNRTERRAFEELFHACEAFLTMSEELQEEYENERDGQPDEQQEWADFDPDC
jgi:polyphosphate kinase 2 (PPK2 family)